MSMKDGGPAFPFTHFDLSVGEQGISARDYFAAKAMQAYLSATTPPRTDTVEEYARGAYAMADAMLKASSK